MRIFIFSQITRPGFNPFNYAYAPLVHWKPGPARINPVIELFGALWSILFKEALWPGIGPLAQRAPGLKDGERVAWEIGARVWLTLAVH